MAILLIAWLATAAGTELGRNEDHGSDPMYLLRPLLVHSGWCGGCHVRSVCGDLKSEFPAFVAGSRRLFTSDSNSRLMAVVLL